MVGAKSDVTWNNITKGLQIVSILSILFAIISFIIYLLKNIPDTMNLDKDRERLGITPSSEDINRNYRQPRRFIPGQS